MFAAIPGLLRPYARVLALAVAVGTLFLGFGVTRIQMDTSFDAWLSDDDPAVQALDDYRRQFGGDDGLFLVYRARDGNVFSASSLAAVRELTARLENWQDIDPATLGIDADTLAELGHITRVQSLGNVTYQINVGDTLESRRLLPERVPLTPDMAAEAARIAATQENLRLLMFSDDTRFGAIVISTDFGTIPVLDPDAAAADPLAADDLDLAVGSFSLEVDENAQVREVEFEDTTPDVYLGFMKALRAVYGQGHSGAAFDFYPIGTAGMMDFSMETMKQAGLLILVAIGIIVLLLYTLFQTGSAVVWPVLTVVSSCLWVFGGMAWAGIPSTQLIALTGMLVLAVGIADCVHVMSEYMLFKREGLNHEEAIARAYGKTGVPILLTSITTMAGMLAIALGGVGQFVTFGISSALGVAAAFIFTVIVLPVLLEFWHPHAIAVPAPRRRWRRLISPLILPFKAVGWVSRRAGLSWALTAAWLPGLLARVPRFAHDWRYPIVTVFMGLFILCSYGATQVKIDSNLVELFKKDTEIRTAYEIVDTHMAGTGAMEIMLDLKASDAFTDARVLQAVGRLQTEIEDRYGDYVVRTYSLADLVEQTNQTMNDDAPGSRRVPDDSTAVSQLLFLFNSSSPEDRRAIVSDDYSRSHVTIQLRNAGSHEYGVIFADIDQVIADSFAGLEADYPGWEAELTGNFALMMRMSDVIAKSQVKSLTLAIVIISAILALTLGSVQGGLLAIVPNMLPAILAFGLMGLLDIPLDTDTLMIAPLIIGIAVDDTIHFVTHYRMALAQGHTASDALIQTVREVGQAVTFTSLVLGTAFLMLGFSDYLGIAKVGIFGSLAIFVALLCDLLFLPALIYIFQPRFGIKTAGRAHYEPQGAKG